MSEEEIKILDYIIKKIEECMNNNNVDTNFYLPIGSYGDFGFVSYNMLLNIRNLQQENSQLKEDIKGFKQERQILYNTIHDLQKANKQLNRKIEKTIEYIENVLQSFLYRIEYKELIEILKGDKE